MVWVGGGVATNRCPKSVITGQSMAWLETFLVWKRSKATEVLQWDARTVEAMLILENEVRGGVKTGGN